jgi:hypothetical protein
MLACASPEQRRALWMDEDAAREFPNLPLEDGEAVARALPWRRHAELAGCREGDSESHELGEAVELGSGSELDVTVKAHLALLLADDWADAQPGEG